MTSTNQFPTPRASSKNDEEPVPLTMMRTAPTEDEKTAGGESLRITPQARYYAVSELARRANVPADFFRAWKVSITTERTVLEIANGSPKQIIFPHASSRVLKSLRERTFHTARALWPDDSAPQARRSRELVLPFVGEGVAVRPLFLSAGQNSLVCTADLPLSVLLTLSRWEESSDVPRDAHGRFPAAASVAWREGFLDRPVVDECGLAFEQALQLLFPTWPKRERTLRVKLSHDVDHVGIPFDWKGVLRHTVRYRAPRNSCRDLIGWLPGLEPSDLRAVRDIVVLASQAGLTSAVYWKASPFSSRDSGYNPGEPKVRRTIEWLREQGADLGAHPGYNTFLCPEKLHREVRTLRELLGTQPLGGRQHYLRWSPNSWIDWENCGLAYDSSVGYAEHIGFRAGTCIPYRPWLFPLNRQAELLEVPLLAMDRTLLGYMGLTRAQCVDAIRDCVDRCRAVGGVFTLLWHNNALLDPVYRSTYLSLLQILGGIPNYEWQEDARHSTLQ